MRAIANLFEALDATNKTNLKVKLLVDYFHTVSDADKVWTIAIFTGRRPPNPVPTKLLKDWCMETTATPQWLFDECYHTVGDLAETIALLLPDNIGQSVTYTLTDIIQIIIAMKGADEESKKNQVSAIWSNLNDQERFIFNKLLTGSFRIGVSQGLLVNALAQFTSLSTNVIAHRIMGNWNPTETDFQNFFFTTDITDDLSKPYPFYLAYPLEQGLEALGNPEDWQAEWKWDGIRSQLIKRNNQIFLWSRGEELITDKFPEIIKMAELLPDNVALDGELLPYNTTLMPFGAMQTRIGRKNLTAKILKEVPIIFMLYDVLEFEGTDVRTQSMLDRRKIGEQLVSIINNHHLKYSDAVMFDSWAALTELKQQSRAIGAEGFMIKNRASPYLVGRKRGDWWKWKLDPLSIDAVLVYAQKGHGRRADLFTDYTFAIWDNDKLVTFAKAYSGLTDVELKKVDSFIRKNTKEKFGPVRTVTPELVFEIGFEGIQQSNRHKSGIAVRFPRILRWRTDKKIEEANTIDDLKALIVANYSDSMQNLTPEDESN